MKHRKNMFRGWGIVPVIVATFILWQLFDSCLKSFDDKFKKIDQDIKDKTTIVLSPDANPESLSRIIYENGYCDSIADAEFIAKTLVERQKAPIQRSFLDHLLRRKKNNRLESLYSLQKRDIGQVSAHVADSCQVLNTALLVSRDKIGIANDSVFPYNSQTDSGLDSITVVVEQELEKAWYQLFKTSKVPCANIPVRLQMHYRDSLGPQIQPIGYGFTDQDGIAIFKGLCADSSYSVLPIREGFEYGQSKGVVGGEWIVQRGSIGRLWHGFMNLIHNRKDGEFRFIEKEHRIPLLSNTALRQIKSERTIIVRTPDEFKNEFVKSRHWVIWSWWALTIVLAFFFRRGKKFPKRAFDFLSGLIMACCMLLSGLCVLMMFSMVDPVNDELKGWDMAIGIMSGVGLTIILLFFDFVKRFNQETRPFKAYNSLKKHHLRGLGWLVLALLLTFLLFLLGKDVGGMKVNLAFGSLVFQPSEIAKYLIVLFSAIFFVENNDRIIHYSQPFDTSFKEKIRAMGWMILGLVGLMIMYVVLGDMGPGLVLGISFTLLYSFCKSIQDLRDRGKNWLKCDLMMLVYGVVSYALLLFIFRRSGIGYWYFWGSVVWFVVWVFLGAIDIQKTLNYRNWIWKKQFHETAVIMNLVIFVFILGNNASSDFGILNRLENRTSVCTNTWGGMDKVFQDVKHGAITQDTLLQDTLRNPVSNIQVANGLWALASGGPWGQGWGNGKPSVIPAFHTDMILSSIGEQRGFKGLCFVIVLYLVLLISVGWKGKKAGDPFVLFFCMGVAIVTAVQLFIIALGSAGAIPLTGVTVPLLSYGKVSMILNIVAFGFVLSLVTREDPITVEEHIKAKKNYVESSKWTLRVAVVMLAAAALFTLGVWANYQFLQREKTLLQPAFVININGDPVLEYNPRIALITNEMYTGRIFDRNGLLLATSNKDDISGKVQDSLIKCGISIEDLDAIKRRHLKRYYPFAEQLFFMVGNLNPTKLLYSYDEDQPVGYMAEVQHLSYLRGFDNRLLDKNKNQAKVRLVTDKKRGNRFLKPMVKTTGLMPLYDYSKLIPYLKDGSGKELEEHNRTVEKGEYDLYLTVDAALQKDIQDNLEKYMNNPNIFGNTRDNFKGNPYYKLMRVSVVVLDAKNGDLLASANYPKPNFNRLEEEQELARELKKEFPSYSDNYKFRDPGWTAYTDIDLGTTRQTAPGSTAKIMSAMAGLMKVGQTASEQKYYVSPGNRVEIGQYPEPSGHKVTMEEAIVKSSNCYFINLVNSNDLYPELETIYKTIGASVSDIVPYYYRPMKDEAKYQRFHNTVAKIEGIALRRYASFSSDEKKDEIKMNMGEWKWAWGQGFGGHELKASPLNMARLASAVVNDGEMPNTQYVINKDLRQEGKVKLLGKDETNILKGYMKKETENHKTNRAKVSSLPSNMGGKTGTAERTIYETIKSKKGIDINDGWYMFFIEGDDDHHPLAVVVRIERGVGSSPAVRLSGYMLLDVLKKHPVIKK